MTNHPDKEREAAIEKAAEHYLSNEGITLEQACGFAIDAFLAASVPADVGEVTMALREFAIAERKRHGGKTNVYEATLADRAADTIALLAAQKKELQDKVRQLTTLLDAQLGTPCEQIRHEQELTAQKAAHAKLLRDEAERFYKNTHWETAAALRFLADMIEGGK